MYGVIRLTTPTQYLSDPELNSWSRDESRAARFDEYAQAVEAVVMRDLLPGRELSVSWDVILLTPRADDNVERRPGQFSVGLTISRTRTGGGPKSGQ